MLARSLFSLLSLLLLAAPGWAGLSTQDYTGTFSLQGLSNLTPIGVGTGSAVVNPLDLGAAHLNELMVPGGLATVTTTSEVTNPALPFTQLQASVRDGSGTVTETPSGILRGQIPLTGKVTVCFLLNCLGKVDVPLTQNGTRGVGLGGPPIVVTAPPFVTISLEGGTWQTGPVSVTGTSTGVTTTLFSTGLAQGAGGETSSTAAGGGLVQLVTPIRVTATAGDGSTTVLGFFGNYEIQFAPEPALGTLLAVGAAAMWGLGRRRRGAG